MSDKQSRVAQELGRFAQAFWLGLPMAALRSFRGDSGEELRDAGWKAYDAWVSLANEAANQTYENPTAGVLANRAMETTLRIQQAGNAVASAFFGNLWPAVGLPTRGEVEALRTEIAALRHEVIQPDGGHREAPGDHRLMARVGDGLKTHRHATVTHPKQRSNEDAAA